MDADTTRAWGLHFLTLAAQYERDAKASLGLARRRPRERARWAADARRLNRAAVSCARRARAHGVEPRTGGATDGE